MDLKVKDLYREKKRDQAHENMLISKFRELAKKHNVKYKTTSGIGYCYRNFYTGNFFTEKPIVILSLYDKEMEIYTKGFEELIRDLKEFLKEL